MGYKMAGIEDMVKSKADSLKGKKAKPKKIDTPPTDTNVKPLPKDLQKALKKQFGCDFSKVRVHTDGNIKEMSKQLKAKAFTIDQNIYLQKASDAKNKELLAHELTHVVQQSGGKLKKSTKGKALVSN